MSAATDQDMLVFLSVERVHTPAAGRHGGRPGAPGRIRIGEDGADLPPKGTIRIPGSDAGLRDPGRRRFRPARGRSDADSPRDLATGLVTDAAPRTRVMIPPRPHIAAMAPYALARMEPPPGNL
jgi:N-methylhydantoinase B